MTTKQLHQLGPRERQIMDVLHARNSATAAEVLEALPDPPSYSAVRRLLVILEEKGHLTHKELNGRYIYSTAQSWTAVARSAMDQVLESFFGGSIENAVATLLTAHGSRPSEEELQRLEALIQKARTDAQLEEHETSLSIEEVNV
jgi:BlaI family penicillinase repressor